MLPLKEAIAAWLSRAVLALVRALGRLPLPVIRGVGLVMGWILFVLAVPRLRVVLVNLALCFPHWTRRQRWSHRLYKHLCIFPVPGSTGDGCGKRQPRSCSSGFAGSVTGRRSTRPGL